ncbi:MAG: CoA pyrophosphatase [Nitrososphaerota archaeon]|nr:CoA pyrophosphatase [Nitrososphaerota archaeon]
MIEHPGREFQGENRIGLPSAAVAMILKQSSGNNDLDALVVKRKAIEHDPWSGHMALPGGRSHSEDTNSLLTARREVFEETSIDLGRCEVLGTLDEVIPGNVMIRVTPYVALAREPVQVRLDESELTDYFWIPLSFFRDRRNLSLYSIERFGKKAEVPSYLYMGKHVIWGMTLKIIQDFLSKTSR